MSVELGNHFSMSTEEMVNNSRPSIDITLGTAAYVYRDKLIGVLLSGANRDGGLGMKHIKDKGGLTIVQEPTECMIDTMPKAALALTKIDHTLKIDEIVEFLKELDKHYTK
jgi:two-component system chemotaxis response regulator CheB